jgi:hypothetical protein
MTDVSSLIEQLQTYHYQCKLFLHYRSSPRLNVG